MNRKLTSHLGVPFIAILALTSCGNAEEDQPADSTDPETVESESPDQEAASSDDEADAQSESESETDDGGNLPDTPAAYSSLTIQGDEEALPEGEEG